jgi:L-alanine-DL-glutamate epimerase-like enolase superfamily enzyme
MKIKQIDVYQLDYNLLDTQYTWADGLSVSAFVSTVIKIITDEDVNGFAEVCPLGSSYMEAFAKGVPAGISEIGAQLIGKDPCQIQKINQVMDSALSGHNYVKSPLDIACWDIFGQKTGLPVCTLLGGRFVDEYPLYRAISQDSPEKMADSVLRYRDEGYHRFQLKVGGDPDEDIARIKAVRSALNEDDILNADANTGWITRNAMRVVKAVENLDVYIEQPCATLEECLLIRQHTNLPMILDEVITGVNPLIRAYTKNAMDAVNIKISRVGGLTKASQIRDLCQSLGIAMTLEDSWGGDITTATIAHLVGSTRPDFYFTSTDFNSYNDVRLAKDAPSRINGILKVPNGPGLGIHVDEAILGKPIISVK